MKAASKQTADADIQRYMQEVGRRARAAARAMARAETAAKDAALMAMASEIERHTEALIAANKKDIDAGKAQGLDSATLDRLELNGARIKSMAEGLRQIAALADPVGEITDLNYRPSGIQVGRMRVPLGVIGIIYESRPNVTADAAGGELIRMKEYVDVIVPRGGKSLIERISAEATIPVIKHLHGVCHVYIDDKADLDKAVKVAFNAKTQRYGTCNTMETLLVARGVAGRVLPVLGKMYQDKGVELRGCEATRKILSGIKAATEEDWHTEYLAPILSIRVVDNVDEAMDHIARYGSAHTDAIVTEDITRARRFLREVDSSSVMVNASTRFADGFEYGLGAEIGISTDKLHARGQVGLEGLTSVKFVVLGDGHIRK